MNNNKVFGIDLGTTYSCISYIDEYGKPVVLKNGEGETTTPSVVMIESDENIVVGKYAKSSIEVESEKTVRFIKRKIGTANDKVQINNKEYSATEISSYILKKLVDDANKELIQTGKITENEKINDVVITCPAYFGENERAATKLAGEIAGLNVLNIINEPTAAAISYGVSKAQNEKETVLVYDLGGGTFDITVMTVDGGKIDVICTDGDSTLGGKNWDEALIKYALELYSTETGGDLSNDEEAVSKLYLDVEEWKKALSIREKINIAVNGPEGRARAELTREKFEELTKDLLYKTKMLVDLVLKKAEEKGCALKAINRILLVGGSSRMPQVEKMIKENYNIAPSLQDPDEAVAKGASVFANSEKSFIDFVQEKAKTTGKSVDELINENLMNRTLDKEYAIKSGASEANKISVTNVLSRSYGIKAYDEPKEKFEICTIIAMNQKLPAKGVRQFSTLEENQKGVEIEIYEYRSDGELDASNQQIEHLEMEDRTPVATVNMQFKKSVPRGTTLTVTMASDNSALLHIIAVENYSGSTLDTTIELSNQMSEKDKQIAEERISKAVVN